MPNLADILFRTADGVYTVNAHQRITYWNNACEQLFGIHSKHVLGKLCSEVVNGKDPEGKSLCSGGCCSRLVKGGNGPKRFALHATDCKGQELQLNVSIVLIPSRHDNEWTCAHLLNRGSATDMQQTLEYYSSNKRGTVKLQVGCDNTPAIGASLTAREREVLDLMTEGLHSTTISQLLNISPVTVRNHTQHIVSKLGVHSQLEAVAYAYRHNLV